VCWLYKSARGVGILRCRFCPVKWHLRMLSPPKFVKMI
jgi:hypothetical protein